jgi:hypothetical protein
MGIGLTLRRSNLSDDLAAAAHGAAENRLTRRATALIRTMPVWERAVVAVAMAALAALMVLEQLDTGLRAHIARHALLAGVVSGGLLLAPLLIVVERTLDRSRRDREDARERRELERWRLPAQEAVQTYLDVAVPFTAKLRDLLRDVKPSFNIATATAAEYADAYREFAKQAPNQDCSIRRLYLVARDEVARSGAVAIGAASTLALYPPLSTYAGPIYRIQRTTRDLAECCLHIYLGRRFPPLVLPARTGHRTREFMMRDRIDGAVQRLAELTFSRMEQIRAVQADLTAEAGPIILSRPDEEPPRESEV